MILYLKINNFLSYDRIERQCFYPKNTLASHEKLMSFEDYSFSRYKSQAKIGPKRVRYFRNFYRTFKKGKKAIHLTSRTETLFAKESAFITRKLNEASRLLFIRPRGKTRRLRRKLKDLRINNQIKLNVFPSISITKKPIHTRMGKGKGKPSGFIGYIQPEHAIFEFNAGTTNPYIKKYQRRLNFRFPIFTKFKLQTRINLTERLLTLWFPRVYENKK